MVSQNKYHNLITLLLMIVITCVTQVLMLMKSSIVAGTFGTSTEMDAYNFANSIVSFIFGFISAGVSTVIIPNYIQSKNRKFVDSFITILYGIIVLIIVVFILLRYQIVRLISSREELFINMTCNILILLFFVQLLSSVTNITVAYFQCKGKYNTPKIINLVSQTVVIISLLIFKDITIIQYTIIIGSGLVFIFFVDTMFAIKNGWRYKPVVLFNDETKSLIKLFIPIVFSTGVYRLSLMVDSIIASRLDTGYLTILSYSSQIATMVNTILIGNMLTYCYPKIVARIKKEKNQTKFWEQVSFFHLSVWLVISCFFVVGKEGIVLLFQHGKFDENATMGVFYGALIYIIGQQTNIIRDLIYRYFYACNDTKTAAGNSIIVSITNIVVSIILVYILGFYGIIIGTIVASLVSLMMIMKRFGNKFGYEISVLSIIASYLKNIMIAILTIIIVSISKRIINISNNVLSIIVFGIETVFVFILISIVLKRDLHRILKEI